MRTLSFTLALALLAADVQAQQSSGSAGHGSIAGSIVTADQQPLAGARVEARLGTRTSSQAAAREDGAFQFGQLPAGSYSVVTTRIGYGRRVDSVRVVAGETARLRIVMNAAPPQLSEVTTTASRRQEKILDAPASVSVVTTQEVTERPALTVMDNVRTLPGVDVAQGGLVQSAIVARGFNNVFSGQMLTLIDNRFASVPSLRVNVPFLFTASNEDIERIEVLLGPAAALYGPNSANGVLHVITKSPFTSQGTTVTLDGGERSVLRAAGRHAGVIGDALAFKLTGEYTRGDDWEFRDPAEPAVFPNTPNTPRARVGQPNARDFAIRRFGGEARLDWRLGDNSEWINTYGIANADNTVELTGANGAAQIRNWSVQSFQSRLRSGRLFAQLFANLSDAGNRDSNDLRGTYLLRTGQAIVDQSRVVGGQAQLASDVGSTSLVYGVDYTFTNPRTGGTINGRNEDDDNTSEIGGYAQSTSHLSSQWDLLLAGRLDRHNRLDGTFFSPRAALVFKPAEGQSVRLTYNRAYSTPANFSFFLDLLQAGNVGGLPYNVRAVGVADGFHFRRDCAGGAGSLCMRSPFTPAAAGGAATFVPANAAGYYPAALGVALAGGLRNALLASGLPAAAVDATIARLGTFDAVGAKVGTKLTYLTNGTSVSPEAVTDVEKLKPSYTNMLELGYKGTVGQKLFLAVDGWYQRRDNFTTAAQNFTPNAMLDGPALGAALATHLAPVLGAAGAAQVAASVAGSLARIPLGTVVPDSRVTTNGDIAFTYRSIDKSINLHGVDVAFDYLLGNGVSANGTYSWMSDTQFDIEPGQPPLLLNSPDHKASLALRAANAPGTFSGELRGRYQNTFAVNSAVFVTGTDLTAPDGSKYQYQQPPTAMFLDAQLSWKVPLNVASGAMISLNASNLLDNKVPMFAGVPAIGRLLMTRLQLTL